VFASPEPSSRLRLRSRELRLEHCEVGQVNIEVTVEIGPGEPDRP